MTTHSSSRARIAALSLLLASGNLFAAVSADQAAELGKSLTPVGAERAGNSDGSIPEWTGGLPVDAGKIDARGFQETPTPPSSRCSPSPRRTWSSTRTS